MKLTKNSKQVISPLWLLAISIGLFVIQFFIGNAGATLVAGLMDILAIVLFIAAALDLVRSKVITSLNRKQRSKLRKQNYIALAEKPVWRLLQALYWLLGGVWAIVLASRDSTNYTDNTDRWSTVALWIVILLVGYILLRRLAVYVLYGKIKKSLPQSKEN